MSTSTDYLHIADWIREELDEHDAAVTPSEQADALFDMLGLVLLAIGELRDRDIVGAHSAYLEAQAVRGRKPLFFHPILHHAINEIRDVHAGVRIEQAIATLKEKNERRAAKALAAQREGSAPKLDNPPPRSEP
jgi:hypothetical protein